MHAQKESSFTLTSSSEYFRCRRYHLLDDIRYQLITRLGDFSKFVDVEVRACERVFLDRVRVIKTT